MKLLLVAIAFSLVLTGCAAAGGSDAPDAAQPSASEPTANRSAPTSTPSTTTVSTRCNGSLEGCFTFNEMDEYLDAITPMVEGFFEAEFAKMPEPRNLVYVPRGQGIR